MLIYQSKIEEEKRFISCCFTIVSSCGTRVERQWIKTHKRRKMNEFIHLDMATPCTILFEWNSSSDEESWNFILIYQPFTSYACTYNILFLLFFFFSQIHSTQTKLYLCRAYSCSLFVFYFILFYFFLSFVSSFVAVDFFLFAPALFLFCRFSWIDVYASAAATSIQWLLYAFESGANTNTDRT